MKLGIFGGSFDPVHNGHLALARACQAAATLDEVWFTPTAVQPLKRNGPHATDAQRLEMLKLALEEKDSLSGEPGRGHRREAVVGPRSAPPINWRTCTLEIDRGGLSYTVDTLRQIHAELPEAELFFLIGADAVRDVPRWKEPKEIVALATPLVVRRADQPESDLTSLAALCPPAHQPQLVAMPAVDISSTEIRRRASAGEPINDLVPPTVANYIATQNLYR